MAKKIVISTFWADGKSVWVSEYPIALTDEQIKWNIEQAEEDGRVKVDAMTDTTGRMLKF